MTRAVPLLILAVAAILGRGSFDVATPPPGLELIDGAAVDCVGPADVVADHVLHVNGLVRIPLCTPGVLRITLTGSAARGRGAHAQVTVGSDVRWDGEVVDAHALEVALDAPGWITISFLNDRREGPEDRNLWINVLAFETF